MGIFPCMIAAFIFLNVLDDKNDSFTQKQWVELGLATLLLLIGLALELWEMKNDE